MAVAAPGVILSFPVRSKSEIQDGHTCKVVLARLGSDTCTHMQLLLFWQDVPLIFQEGLGDVVGESQAGQPYLCYKSIATAGGG